MDAEAALAWLDTIIPPQTGEQLSDLQKVILVQVWLGRKYLDIAHSYGCTEGHAKDAGSQLWKLLSKVLRSHIFDQEQYLTRNQRRVYSCIIL